MSNDPALQTLHEAAKIALKEHRYNDAIHHLERAVGHDPNDVVAYTMTGIAHQRLGHVDMALRAFRHAVQIDPNDAVAHFNLGQMMHIAGDDEEACECLTRCLEVDPHHESAVSLLAKLQAPLNGNLTFQPSEA